MRSIHLFSLGPIWLVVLIWISLPDFSTSSSNQQNNCSEELRTYWSCYNNSIVMSEDIQINSACAPDYDNESSGDIVDPQWCNYRVDAYCSRIKSCDGVCLLELRSYYECLLFGECDVSCDEEAEAETKVPEPQPTTVSSIMPTQSVPSSFVEYKLTRFDYRLENGYEFYGEDIESYVAFSSDEEYLFESYGTRMMLPPQDLPSLCGETVPDSIRQQGAKYAKFAPFSTALFLNKLECPSTEVLENAQRMNSDINGNNRGIEFLLIPMNSLIDENTSKSQSNATVPPTSTSSNTNSNIGSYYSVDNYVALFLLPEKSLLSIRRIFEKELNRTDQVNTDGISSNETVYDVNVANLYYAADVNSIGDIFIRIEQVVSTTPDLDDPDLQEDPCLSLYSSCSQDDDGSAFNIFAIVIIGFFMIAFLARMLALNFARRSLQLNQSHQTSDTDLYHDHLGTNTTANKKNFLTEEEFVAFPVVWYQSQIPFHAGPSNVNCSLTEEVKSLDTVAPNNKFDNANGCIDHFGQQSSATSSYFDHETADQHGNNDNKQLGTDPTESNICLLVSSSSSPPTKLCATTTSTADVQKQLIGSNNSGNTNVGETVVHSDSNNNDTNLELCAICVEPFQHNELVRVLPRCRHIYHTECIREWLLERHSKFCPICKVAVKNFVSVS